jgi:hypothetical protein
VRKTCVRKMHLSKICAISLFTIVSTFAKAQLPSSGNGFFGYSYVRGDAFANSPPASVGGANLSGWDASVEGKYLPWLGVVGDLDWHYGGHNITSCVPNGPCSSFRLNVSRNTLLFGPRASMTYKKYRPFAELLLGIGHQSDKGGDVTNSGNSFAIGFGGGMDYHLVRMVSVRAKIDAIHTSFFGNSELDPRFSTGVVFSF